LSGVLFDNSAWARTRTSDTVRTVIAELGATEVPHTCAIVELEVLFSSRSAEEYERWRATRRAGYVDIPLTAPIGARALDVQRHLARNGHHRAVRLADLLIAACAEAAGATVVHYDADYDLIAEVTGQPTQWVVPRGSAD
jgi:predicted nucleic acid-binding protein